MPVDARRSNRQDTSMKFWPVDEEKGFDIVEHLERIGNNYGKSVAQTAINWLLQRQAVSGVIIVARNTEQLIENVGASGWQFSPDDVEHLDNISKPTVPYPVWHQKYSDER